MCYIVRILLFAHTLKASSWPGLTSTKTWTTRWGMMATNEWRTGAFCQTETLQILTQIEEQIKIAQKQVYAVSLAPALLLLMTATLWQHAK